jgi:hypothetical protein
MAGGIQKGTEAGSVESKLLDGDVRIIAEAIARAQNTYCYERGHRNLLNERFGDDVRSQAQLPEIQSRGITIGCVPDGGMWFDGDRKTQGRQLKVVFEAKHQQNGGNAIERWATNHAVCSAINPEASYVTFATGGGAVKGGVLHSYGESMRAIYPNTKWHYSEQGFTQEQICTIMTSELGLDLTFEQVKPHIGFVVDNNFEDLFVVKTPEEIVEETLIKQELNRYDEQFVELLQTPTSPLSRVWAQIDRDDKVDAKEIAVEMLQADARIGEIADILKDIFVVK